MQTVKGFRELDVSAGATLPSSKKYLANHVEFPQTPSTTKPSQAARIHSKDPEIESTQFCNASSSTTKITLPVTLQQQVSSMRQELEVDSERAKPRMGPGKRDFIQEMIVLVEKATRAAIDSSLGNQRNAVRARKELAELEENRTQILLGPAMSSATGKSFLKSRTTTSVSAPYSKMMA